MTIEELSEEAELVVGIARLIRGLEGAKDWAARSGASGLEQWCSEALSPTGKLDVFPADATAGDLISRALHRRELAEKDATIKALADTLAATGYVSHDGWHTRECVCGERGSPDPDCVAVRDVLALVGR